MRNGVTCLWNGPNSLATAFLHSFLTGPLPVLERLAVLHAWHSSKKMHSFVMSHFAASTASINFALGVHVFLFEAHVTLELFLFHKVRLCAYVCHQPSYLNFPMSSSHVILIAVNRGNRIPMDFISSDRLQRLSLEGDNPSIVATAY